MARLSDLTSAVATASGVPDTAARVIARSLRETGLVAKGGRGLSAARMGPTDVASILLAFASPADVTKSGQVVATLGELQLEGLIPVLGSTDHRLLYADDEVERTGLFTGQTLSGALAQLIERYSCEGRLPPSMPKTPPEPKAPHVWPNLSADPYPHETDPTPCALTLTVTKDEYGWRANLQVAERGGCDLMLSFSPNGGTWPPRRRREENPGRSHTITLPPEIAHAAVRCIRDDMPSDSRPGEEG